MNELALFAGAGGGILGGHLLGWRCVCAVEIEDYPRRVLLARQRDGILPRFPIWDDITTFNGRPWRGRVDVISGGFPCQDISAAGKGAGITGTRSGLWTHMARVVGEVRPRYVFVENSPLLVSRGLDVVLGDLAAMGFNARWGVIGACCVGAPHTRERVWIMATDTNSNGPQKNTDESAVCKSATNNGMPRRLSQMGCAKVWADTCPVGARIMGVDNGVAHDVDRIKAIGNGQVPAVAALAWEILTDD